MDINNLIGEIYEASLNPSLWGGVLSNISTCIDSEWSTIVVHDRLNRNHNKFFNHGVEKSLSDFYEREMIDLDMEDARKHLQLVDEEVVHDFYFDDFSYAREIRDENDISDQKRESIAEYFVCISRLAAKLFMTPNSIAIATSNRKKRIENQIYSDHEKELFSLMIPHIARSIRIHKTIITTRSQGEKLLQTFNQLSNGVLLLDKDMRVIYSNEEAIAILRRNPCLQIGRNGCLTVTTGLEHKKLLTALLVETLNGQFNPREKFTPSIGIPSHTQTHPLKISALRLSSSELDISLKEEGIQLAVFVNDPEREIVLSDTFLKNTYKMTRTEAQIANDIANGLSISEISNKRSTAELTTRGQVKTIMQKMEVHTQGQLIKLLMNLRQDFSLSL